MKSVMYGCIIALCLCIQGVYASFYSVKTEREFLRILRQFETVLVCFAQPEFDGAECKKVMKQALTQPRLSLLKHKIACICIDPTFSGWTASIAHQCGYVTMPVCCLFKDGLYKRKTDFKGHYTPERFELFLIQSQKQ